MRSDCFQFAECFSIIANARHLSSVALLGSAASPPIPPSAAELLSSRPLGGCRHKSEVAQEPEDDSEPSFSATELAGLAAKLAETAYSTTGGQPICGRGPLLAYNEGKEEGLLRSDPKQEATVLALQRLYDDLVQAIPAPSSRGGSGLTLIDAAENRGDSDVNSSKPWWKSLFGTKKTDIECAADEYEPEVQGLYMYGGVGCGKTMLMDLFAACAPLHFKLERTHFHDFMIEVHSKLRMHQSTPDPLSLVATEIATECRVLCLDEFFVTDVADAMILHRLFAKLWEHDLVLVATSNRHPDALYEGGLQRALFLPFISKLKQACVVHNMASPTDYRKLAQHRGGLYFIDENREHELNERFLELANNNPVVSQSIEVAMGRILKLPRVGGCIAQFTFNELCNKPLGAADYIALANAKHTVALSGVPKFSGSNRTAAYRFVTLIDVLYEHRVRLLCSAEAMPLQLFENIKTNQDFKADVATGGGAENKISAEEVVRDETREILPNKSGI
jgi:peroxisome-assembly ATPase